MPGTFAALETGFPELEGKTTEQKLRALTDYLYQLLEQLRYTLRNLGEENFNPTDLQHIMEPIHAEIEDEVAGLSTRIDADETGIQTLVTKTGINSLGQDETLYSEITQNADAITAEVTRATGAEATLTLTAQGLRTDVNAASGEASSAQQTADGIKAQVTDGQGNYTVLNLKSDGLHIGNASGTSTIDGGNITANSITLSRLGSDVTNSFGDDNPAYIKSTYIDFRQVQSPRVYAGDFYGGKYHDADGDSTLDIESFTGFTALMYGPNTMQSLADATLGVYEFGNNHVGHLYIGGEKILTAGGSQSQATKTQNLWDFTSKGMVVMYGTDAPATYFSNHGLTPATGQVYFKI